MLIGDHSVSEYILSIYHKDIKARRFSRLKENNKRPKRKKAKPAQLRFGVFATLLEIA